MKKLLSKLCLFVFIANCCFSDDTKNDNNIDTLKKTFSVEEKDIGGIVTTLSKTYLFPVCAESAEFLEDKMNSTLNFKIYGNDETLNQVLDRFIKDYPQYSWEYNNDKSFALLYPKNSTLGNCFIENVNIQNQSIEKIYENDLLHLRNHGMDISFGMGGNLAWAERECINIATDKKNIRDILYMICGQLTPKPFIWILDTRRKPLALWDGKGTKIYKEIRFRKVISDVFIKK